MELHKPSQIYPTNQVISQPLDIGYFMMAPNFLAPNSPKLATNQFIIPYPLLKDNMAIEAMTIEIVDFPMKSDDFP